MIKRFFLFIVFILILSSCSQQNTELTNKFIRIEGQKFVDQEGRQVILNGINLISKNPTEKYIPPQGIETFQQFKNWGFNCIRLGIIWDGLEPEPGKYNEEYLLEIDKRIEWAGENGIYVFLDMHQDLYGAKFSDGAPDWATIDEGKPHYKGEIWSDSYLISPAVQTAFDHFWNNSPAPDGIGIQDRYANLWKHIAERYANNPNVIGYDIMNEPFMGTAVNEIMPVMLGAYAKLLVEETGQEPPSPEELTAMWSDEESRLKALEFISTKEKYAKVVDAVYELNAAFEKKQLQKMYQKVSSAIREVDQNHLLFFNHSYFSNTGVPSAIEPTLLADGSKDPGVVYAAHGYDLVVDTKEVKNPSYERVEFIFNRIHETGKRMDVPVMIGEWGAFHDKSLKMIETAQHVVNLFEDYKFSNTYWAYYENIDDFPYFNSAIIRPYPAFVSGELISYDYNFESGEFTCTWEEKGENNAPTVIFVPNLKNLSENEIILLPSADQIVFEYCEISNAGKLMISPVGEKIQRSLKFTLRPFKEEEISIK